MQQFRSFQALYLCFTSGALYRDVLLRWRGFGFTHLLLLNMLLITPAMAFIMYDVDSLLFTDGAPSATARELIDEITPQIPELVFKDGTLNTQVEQPHLIYAHLSGQRFTIARIELDANADSLQTDPALMLLTREAVYLKDQNGKIESRNWQEMMSQAGVDLFVLNSSNAQLFAEHGMQWLHNNKLWVYATFATIGWCGTLLIMALYRIFQALLFGGAVILIAGMMKLELNYQEAVRLTCMAITPPIIADAALTLLLGQGISLPLFLLLTLGYCFMAVKSNQPQA